MKPANKARLDLLLVQRGFFASREKAQRAILAGAVFANGQRADKPGSLLSIESVLDVKQKDRYVGRGGLKLEAALEAFTVDPSGQVCVDIGASTGGFTDCLLQRGAARVYAWDVGHSQLDWKIRSDPRVVVREKFNARYLTADDLPEPVFLGVIDVSFISLTLILPPICAAMAARGSDGTVIALVKPQFELARGEVGPGGIIRDEASHLRAVEKIRGFVEAHLPTWRWTGLIDSPILGTEGNKEFLACLRN